MIEGCAWSGEAAAGQGVDALLSGRWRLPFVFQGQHQNALETADVDQIEAERSGARRFQAFGRVAFAQPQQPLALAQLGPREGRIQQAFGELANVRTERHRLETRRSGARMAYAVRSGG